jgi:serine phosphatase RsbU (regulator of sigma subunit)
LKAAETVREELMQKILTLLLVLVFSAATAQAITYSCRDKQGRLFMTDNLQALPAECRGQGQALESKDPDNLNYVPAQEIPQGAGAEFQQTILDAQLEQQQKQEQAEKMLQRAEQLAEQYQQALQEKNNATRRWSYGSREIIQKADGRIEKAREGKQRLMAEMKEHKISGEVEKRIVVWLDKIVD